MTKGFDVLDTEDEFNVIKKVGPGGQYLQEMHTAMNFKSEHYTAKLFNLDGYKIN